MAIRMSDDFQARFEALLKAELERLHKSGMYEAVATFEGVLLSGISFDFTSGPWEDNYCIVFPSPEKVGWEEVERSLRAGFEYLAQAERITAEDLTVSD